MKIAMRNKSSGHRATLSRFWLLFAAALEDCVRGRTYVHYRGSCEPRSEIPAECPRRIHAWVEIYFYGRYVTAVCCWRGRYSAESDFGLRIYQASSFRCPRSRFKRSDGGSRG